MAFERVRSMVRARTAAAAAALMAVIWAPDGTVRAVEVNWEGR